MAAHSKIGASSAYRWLECPGSVKLCEEAPEQKSSIYADEGTAAHSLAEKCFKANKDAHEFIGLTIKANDNRFEVDEEMAENVQVYLDTVRADRKKHGDVFGIETRIHLKWIHENMFGTSDSHCGKRKKRLIVHDYKHGAGVPVDVVDNSQILYYMLGVACLYDFDFEEYEGVIVQPRAHHPDGPVRRWVVTKERLREFERELKSGLDRVEKARESRKIMDWLKPGDHCRWCAAAITCPALQRKMELAVFEDFDHVDDDILSVEPTPPHELSPKKLTDALKFASILESWITQVRSYAYQKAMEGQVPEGYKVVQKYGRRKIRDTDKVADTLLMLGFKPDDIFQTPKLKPLSTLKKLFKKREGWDKDLLRGFTVTPETGSALVPIEDKREALVNRVEDDFANVTDDID